MNAEELKVLDELEAVLLEVRAQVRRLRADLTDAIGVIEENEGAFVSTALAETRAQSVAHIEAAVLRKWAARFGQEAYPKYEDKYGEGHYVALTNVSRMLHEECDALGAKS
jgi:hypothetical protein